MDNEEPTAYFTIQCWGCNKAVTRPYSGHDDVQHKIELLKMGGWRRREFGPNASPWFCSDDCATNSYNARQAEEWWAAKEWRKKDEKIRFGMLMGFGILVLIPMFCLAMGWCN